MTIIAFVMVTPVHVWALVATSDAARIDYGVADPALPRAPHHPMDVQIVAETGTATIVLPRSLSEALARSHPDLRVNGWTDAGTAGTLVATKRGAEISVRGAFDRLQFSASAEEAARLRVRVNDVAATIEVHGANVPFVVSGPEERVVASTRTFLRSTRIQLERPVHRVEKVALGLLPLDHREHRSPLGGIEAVSVGPVQVMKAVLASAVRSSRLVIAGTVTIVVALLVGTAVERLARRRTRLGAAVRNDGIWPWPVRMLGGLAASAAIVGAANYLIPARLAVWLVALLALGGAVSLLHPERGRAPRGLETDAVAITSFILAVAVFPAIVTDRWSLGLLQTDIYDVLNVGQLFWERPITSAGTIFGDGFRSLDYTLHGALWGSLLRRPGDAVLLARYLLLIAGTPIAYELARSFGLARVARMSFAIVTVGSPVLLSLFVEGYVTRHLFASWALVGTLLAFLVLQDAHGHDSRWAVVGVILAVPLALVPPYFLFAPAALIVLLWWHIRLRRDGTTRSVPPGSATTEPEREARDTTSSPRWGMAVRWGAVAALPNLLWLRSVDEAREQIEHLNALATNIVVPFFDQTSFPAALLGLLPFHAHRQHRLGLPTEALAPEWVTQLVTILGSTAVLAAVLALLLASLVAPVRGGMTEAHRLVRASWVSLAAVYVVGLTSLVLLFWESQTYFTLMWAWTLAPIFVACVAVGIAQRRDRGERRSSVAVVALLLLAILSLFSSALETTRWLEHPAGPLTDQWNYDVAEDLRETGRVLRSGELVIGPSVEVVVGISPMLGTDDDRVMVNYVHSLLQAHGTECSRCGRLPGGGIEPLRAPSGSSAVVIVGGGRCASSVLLELDRMTICA